MSTALSDFLYSRYRIRKDRDRSPMSCEDEHTQTSSPGGWQAKLQALNFLNLQVNAITNRIQGKSSDNLIVPPPGLSSSLCHFDESLFIPEVLKMLGRIRHE